MAQGEFTYGSDDFKRGTLDVGGAVTDFLNVRLSALYQDADSFRDFNFTDRWGLAPSIGIALTKDTGLTQESKSVINVGVIDNLKAVITPAMATYLSGLLYRNTRTSWVSLARLGAPMAHDTVRRVL